MEGSRCFKGTVPFLALKGKVKGTPPWRGSNRKTHRSGSLSKSQNAKLVLFFGRGIASCVEKPKGNRREALRILVPYV